MNEANEQMSISFSDNVRELKNHAEQITVLVQKNKFSNCLKSLGRLLPEQTCHNRLASCSGT
jgi:DNA-binding NtrC family response regulator